MVKNKNIFFIILALFFAPNVQKTALASDSLNVLMYSRFNEIDNYATNTSLYNFREHINEILTKKTPVLNLKSALLKIKGKKNIPNNSIALTFEGAFSSYYEKAYPILKEHQIEHTVFVPPSKIGKKDFMNWEELKKISKEKFVTIGMQSMGRKKIPVVKYEENKKDIIRAKKLIEEKLNITPVLFSYPYGYANKDCFKILKKQGFIAAFGQHSGSVFPKNNFYYLPRFTMTGSFSSLERLKTASKTKAFKVKDVFPINPTIKPNDPNPPFYGFTVIGYEKAKDIKTLNCYPSNGGKAKLEFLGKRVEIRVDKPFEKGHTGRINCTYLDNKGSWHWFGYQYYFLKIEEYKKIKAEG